MDNKKNDPKQKLLEEQVIEIKSVVKVNKGGRQRRFSATVVVGDRHGKVGLGMGKANEVPDAIKKAIQDANKNLITVPLTDERTIAYEVIGNKGAARVLLKPAAAGTGARTKNNMANATLDALKQIKTPEHIAELRGKKVEEILG